MKKLLSALLALMMCLSLAACGRSVEMNDNNLRSAKIIVNAVDAYLDGETDAKEAHDIIESEVDNIDSDDTHGSTFESSATGIYLELSHMAYDNGGDLSKIKEYRNKIAGWAGLNEYK